MNSAALERTSTSAGKPDAGLFHMVYVSAATQSFTSEDLVALLDRSRSNNTRADVTGMLLYHDGNFMQVLEGPEAAVRRVYQRISQDPRHRGCIVLIQQAITQRTFAHWSMGFRDSRSSELRSHPGYSDYLNPGAKLPQDPAHAWQLLSSFRQSLR